MQVTKDDASRCSFQVFFEQNVPHWAKRAKGRESWGRRDGGDLTGWLDCCVAAGGLSSWLDCLFGPL